MVHWKADELVVWKALDWVAEMASLLVVCLVEQRDAWSVEMSDFPMAAELASHSVEWKVERTADSKVPTMVSKTVVEKAESMVHS